MIVELAGLPGAGKTTSREQIVTVLASNGHVVAPGVPTGPRSGRIARRLVVVLQHPRLLLLVLSHLRRDRRPLRERVFAARSLAVVLERTHTPSVRTGGAALVLDEGPVQRAVQLFAGAHGPDLEAARRYARLVPVPDVVVRLAMPAQLSVDRTAGRPRGLPPRFARLAPAEQLTALGGSDRVLDVVIETLRQRRPELAVVTVDARDHDAREAVVRRAVLTEIENVKSRGQNHPRRLRTVSANRPSIRLSDR